MLQIYLEILLFDYVGKKLLRLWQVGRTKLVDTIIGELGSLVTVHEYARFEFRWESPTEYRPGNIKYQLL
jgi:hypothetical protein